MHRLDASSAKTCLEMAAELAASEPAYAAMALKFIEHFLWIASAMIHIGRTRACGMKRTALLRRPPPAGRLGPALEDSLAVGLLPLCRRHDDRGRPPGKVPRNQPAVQWFLERVPSWLPHPRPEKTGVNGRVLAAILDETKLRRVLSTMLDENEFLSPHGIPRCPALTRPPLCFRVGDQEYRVSYLPAESDTGMFGGIPTGGGRSWDRDPTC